MKKILLIFVFAGMTLISCKKNYSCSCSTTVFPGVNSGQYYYTSQSVKMTAKMTKKQAQSVCDNEADNLNATYTDFFGVPTGNPNQATSTSVCTLD